MKIAGAAFVLVGIWFLASAATENGLLPSGHAMGRIPEIILGILLVIYGAFRLFKTPRAR